MARKTAVVEGEIGEVQHRFRKGRGTTNGMFAMKLKKQKGQEDMTTEFIDLENGYCSIPREIAMASLTWVGVRKAEVRQVEGTYEGTKSRLFCRSGLSGEFEVNVGMTHGRDLSPLLFIAVVDVISSKIGMKNILRKLR